MPITPAEMFEESFQWLRPEERKVYCGKLDLNTVESEPFRRLLVAIRIALNEMLNLENRDVPGHVDHRPFYIDYVDSSEPNAIAFPYKDYSFIGITLPLIYLLWNTSHLLSESEMIDPLVDVHLQGDEREGLRVVLFRTMLFFVVAHEWTHHVHGHVEQSPSIFVNEVLVGDQTGDLNAQIQELDADGYATYHVLENLINGSSRLLALALLKLEAEPADIQNRALLSCFVAAVLAFLFVLPARPVERILTGSHPPPAARLNFLMRQAMSWCARNRPGLDEAWMALNRFSLILTAVTGTIVTITGGPDWQEQVGFLLSELGSDYVSKLGAGLENHIRSLAATA